MDLEKGISMVQIARGESDENDGNIHLLFGYGEEIELLTALG
jgi:hypothetical protein